MTPRTAPCRIALTPGEPGGIGPDLAVRLAQQKRSDEIVAIACPDLLAERAALLGLPLTLKIVDYSAEPAIIEPGMLAIEPLALAGPARAGQLNPENAGYVLACLDRAVDRCRDSACAAMATGPVHKAVINDAGIAFSGHTGYLAERCGSGEPVMMLATEDGALRVALATVHIPLSAVPGAINQGMLMHCLRVVQQGLQERFGIAQPRILVAGLNPHAGEDGYLGREEIDTIAPALATARSAGIDVIGPLPADTLFTAHRLEGADAVLAMYHDQGLPVIKHLGFGRTVNITLGLPIVRTSVDHGTALDLAGSDQVDTGSMNAALRIAAHMARGGRGT